MIKQFSKKLEIVVSILIVCIMSFFIMPENIFATDDFREGQEKFVYDHEERPDPFLPLLTSKGLIQDTGPTTREEMMSHVERITVNGILWDEDNPIVLINNKMRKTGDVVEELTIKEINVNGIILGYRELTYEILLIKKKDYEDQGGFQ